MTSQERKTHPTTVNSAPFKENLVPEVLTKPVEAGGGVEAVVVGVEVGVVVVGLTGVVVCLAGVVVVEADPGRH